MGFGVNVVTGDYSRGATGLWIENGAAHPCRRRGHHRRQPGRDAAECDRHRQRSGVSRRGSLAHAAHRRHDHCGKCGLSGMAARSKIPRLQCNKSLSIRPTPRPRWRNCRRLRQSLRSMARRRTPSRTLAARPICADGWNGCFSPRPNIRAACSWPGACGRFAGGSPARSLSRCCSVRLFWKRSTAPNLLSGCTWARRPLSAFWAAIAYPRITVTNRPSQREADWAYGPFPSRAAAERFADEALKLFLLRRCTEELSAESRAIPAASTPR